MRSGPVRFPETAFLGVSVRIYFRYLLNVRNISHSEICLDFCFIFVAVQ
jgi:hypothetical protein